MKTYASVAGAARVYCDLGRVLSCRPKSPGFANDADSVPLDPDHPDLWAISDRIALERAFLPALRAMPPAVAAAWVTRRIRENTADRNLVRRGDRVVARYMARRGMLQ